jgi:hypothetical protein
MDTGKVIEIGKLGNWEIGKLDFETMLFCYTTI